MPLKLRLVLAGCAGFVAGCLMSLLPWWGALVVLAGATVWAVVQVLSVQRDLNRIRDEIASWETELNEDTA